MTPDVLAGIQLAFSRSIEPIVTELRGIHHVLDEHTRVLSDHSRLLHEHSQLLQNIDGRLVGVEGLLSFRRGSRWLPTSLRASKKRSARASSRW